MLKPIDLMINRIGILMNRKYSIKYYLLNQKILLTILILALFATSFRLIWLIKTYAVNIFFVDEWDIYNPMFNHSGLWQIFDMQYGPHRQGFGGIIIWLISGFTHWSAIGDAYASFGLVLFASIAALALKRILFGKWAISDIVIPIIFLTVSQFETFVITPNEAHSAFPLLGVMLFGLSWLIPNRIARYASVLITNFVTMFTGFGVFIGLITPILLLLDLFQAITSKNKRWLLGVSIALMLSLITIALFFYNYFFAPAVTCFKITPGYIIKYPAFMAVTLSRFLSVDYATSKWLSLGIGLVLLIPLAITLIYQAYKILIKSSFTPTNYIGFAFSGFSLLFLFNAAVGRICLSMAAAYASRYVTLTIPGLFSIYLLLISLPKIPWRNLSIVLFLALISISIPLRGNDIKTMEYYTNGKIAWRNCYLQIENAEACNQKTNFWVYPPITMTSQAMIDAFHQKLDYIKDNHLNFYSDH
jgi:hypothetical protein